jgi:hypothetical protein
MANNFKPQKKDSGSIIVNIVIGVGYGILGGLVLVTYLDLAPWFLLATRFWQP